MYSISIYVYHKKFTDRAHKLLFSIFVTTNVKKTPHDTIQNFQIFQNCIPYVLKIKEYALTISEDRVGLHRGTHSIVELYLVANPAVRGP